MMLLGGLLYMSVLPTTVAQTPLTTCLDDFDDTIDEILANATGIIFRRCAVVRGIPSVVLIATQTAGPACEFQGLFLKAGSGEKSCSTGIINCGGAPNHNHTHQITGKVAARWKKFLKGDGCQDVINAVLP